MDNVVPAACPFCKGHGRISYRVIGERDIFLTEAPCRFCDGTGKRLPDNQLVWRLVDRIRELEQQLNEESEDEDDG